MSHTGPDQRIKSVPSSPALSYVLVPENGLRRIIESPSRARRATGWRPGEGGRKGVEEQEKAEGEAPQSASPSTTHLTT